MKRNEKKELEYPDAPSGFVTLYNYKEPFMEYKDGFGYQGVLLFDGKTEKVQCHLCGEWHEALGHHLRFKHKIRAKEYKEMVGLRASTALIGDKYRAKLIASGLDRRIQNLRPGGKKTEEEKQKIRETLSRLTREKQNTAGTCPAQLIERLRKVAERLGRTPTHAECDSLEKTASKVFGSWQAFVKAAGLKPRKVGENVHYNAQTSFTDEQINEFLRQFQSQHGRPPSKSDFRRGLMIVSYSTMRKRFGTLQGAFDSAGINY